MERAIPIRSWFNRKATSALNTPHSPLADQHDVRLGPPLKHGRQDLPKGEKQAGKEHDTGHQHTPHLRPRVPLYSAVWVTQAASVGLSAVISPELAVSPQQSALELSGLLSSLSIPLFYLGNTPTTSGGRIPHFSLSQKGSLHLLHIMAFSCARCV